MVRAVHRLSGGVVRRGQGRRTSDEARIRSIELKPDLKTMHVCLVENIKDIYMLTKCLGIYIIFCDKNDTRVVHRRPQGCARTDRRNGSAHHSGAKRADTWRGWVKR